MSNIKKIAPYLYLTKRSSGLIYDLYLLVPVDSKKTVDLSNVEPTSSGSRIFISYSSSTPNPSEIQPLYVVKHWVINNAESTFEDIQVQADGDDDLTTLVSFVDADTEPATSTNEQHTFAPYLFVGQETSEGHNYFCPSDIVLFEEDAGAQNQELTFSTSNSIYTMTPGNSSAAISNPENFAVNQDVHHEISSLEYTFEGVVNAAFAKPVRKGKIKKIWAS